MSISNFFADLKLNKARNVVIYASFTLLVISLLFSLQNINNSYVQKAAFSFFVYGLFLWLIENMAKWLIELSDDDLVAVIVLILWGALVIIGFIIVFKIAFNLEVITTISNWRNETANMIDNSNLTK